MKMIRRKKLTFIFMMLSVLLCASLILVALNTVPNAEHAKASSENVMTDYDSTKPLNMIATIEDDLREQGTTIVEVLQNRKNAYLEELSISSANRSAILAKISVIEEAIISYDNNATTIQSSREISNVSNTLFKAKVNPNCTCDNSVLLPAYKCPSCIEYDSVKAEVVTIGTGFEVRGWNLAADLIWHNLSNTEYDSDYWPRLKDDIIDSPQIVKVAQNKILAEASIQESPGWLHGIFESTIEGDMYNSLGSFYYSKKDAGNGNVDIDIIDRYDWAYSENGGSASVFNDTLAKAQDIGVVTPFYTRINFTIPGYVPYNWEYTDDGVAITGIASDITIAEIPATIIDLRIKPKDKVPQPEVNITSIGVNAFANKTNLEKVVLLKNETNEPSKLNTIGNSAFSGCSNLTSILDLSNVTYIGDNAFYNCKELPSVTAPKISYLGKSAFAECSKLKEVSFGANAALKTISERVFYNTGLSNFEIPVNVVDIEDEAFLGSAITSIVGNNNYVWQGNVLIKCNVTDTSKKIAVYVNPTVSSITFPNNVAILSANLFINNANIKTVYLNNVENIGPDAFRNSSLINIHNADNVIDCDKTAVIGTPWYNNKGDSIVLGKVLIEYRGTGKTVILPDNIYRIGADCFSNNTTTQVVLPEQIDSIGRASFKGLIALESVIFTSDLPPLLDGDCFNENVVLYVKESRLSEYKNNISFTILPNTITTKEIQINFYDEDGDFIGESIEYYGSKFNNYIKAPIIKGKDFCGWDYYGFKLNINDMIEHYDNLDLTAEYEIAQYQITIVGEDGEQITTIEYGQQLSLTIPSENGKIFKGWYDAQEGGNQIIDTTGVCVWDRTMHNDTLYAQFDLIEYKMFCIDNNGDVILEDTFTVKNPITKSSIPTLQKFGYVFKQWLSFKGINLYEEFISTSGIFNDILLVAEWEGKKINAVDKLDVNYLTVSDPVAIVDLTSASANKSYNITIASSVKSVTFVGKIGPSYSITINISNRNKALLMGFENIKFQPPGGKGANAISSSGNVMIYITYFGINEIRGGTGVNGTGNGVSGGNGGYGILAGSVTLMAYDASSKINIYGGNGGKGSNGYNGSNGKNGTKGPSGSMFNPIKGENGANGSNGSNGGNGGDGGYAIYSRLGEIFITENSSYEIKGGNGGNGGKGGNGGNGGSGADDTSANPFTGVGAPGDGGNGGNGGANGGAGQGSLGTNCGQLTTVSGEIGADGKAGSGGAAGSGGSHGTVGDDGADGTDGKSGSDGEAITTPMGDGLADGQTQADDALVDLPYAFSAEFIEMFLS